LKLKALHRFTSTATAVEDITALQEGKIGKGLKKFLTTEMLDKGKGKNLQQLVVVDPHLGQSDPYENQSPIDLRIIHTSAFYLEKVKHQCQIIHNGEYRTLARHTKSVGCIIGWVGPQRLGDNELRSQSFSISVGTKGHANYAFSDFYP
jgi:hypothetical protein